MNPTLSKKLKKIYYRYKDKKNPPVPIRKIKKCLEFEGILDDRK